LLRDKQAASHCHDGDSTTQAHSPEFYKNYHALCDALPWSVERTYRWLTPKKLASLGGRGQQAEEPENAPETTPAIEISEPQMD
jgi:hypothetical protein